MIRRKQVHLTGYSRLARGEVRVVVDRASGLVSFRIKRRHTVYTLPLDVWVGLGFDFAAKAAALEARRAKLTARKARRECKEG